MHTERDNAIYNLWQYAEKVTGSPVEHRRVRIGDIMAVQLGLPEMKTPDEHYARNRAVTACAAILGLQLEDGFVMSDTPTIQWRVYA
jgi:hypothetical protein